MNIASAVQVIASAAWLIVIGLLVIVVMRAGRGQGNKGFSSYLIVGVIIAIVLSVVGAGLVFIEPDELGVVVTASQGGIKPEPLGAGIHFLIPFVERVERFSILRQTYTMATNTSEGQVTGDDSIQVRTKDGQQVYIDASVIYAIDPLKAVNLYKTWRNTYQDGLVRPATRGIIRDVSSQFGVEEIVTSRRTDMEQQITEALTKTFSDNNLVLQNFVVRNIRFSDEYAKAVEQKQISEQQAQQAAFIVQQKKQEAEQARQTAQGAADAAVIAAKGSAEARIVQAEAEAKALALVADVLKQNPNLLQYQYITKLASNIQIMLLPSNAPFILPQFGTGTSTFTGSLQPSPTPLPSPTVTP